MATVVSRAYGLINDEERKTGAFRHAFAKVEARTATKIELLENNVLQLNNEFMVAYFIGTTMFDKTFVLEANNFSDEAAVDLQEKKKKGIIGK